MRKSIINLKAIVDSLPQTKKILFNRIFRVSETVGSLVLPKSMEKWVIKMFGSVKAVEAQKVVRVTNLITWEESLFNELRTKRPTEARRKEGLEKLIRAEKGDPFCNPLALTPEDSFGRVRGKHCVTASNVAKYDYFHGLVVFDDHNPLVFEKAKVSNYIQTAVKWFEEANKADPSAIYPFFTWNCLWRAGASIIHGHVQLTLTKSKAYSKIEFLRRAARAYENKYGSSYWNDLFKIHSCLGLGIRNKTAKIMAYLTPVKEKEILIIAARINEDLKHSVYEVLNRYHELGVRSFNLVIIMPPLVRKKGWENFPIIARGLDRGDLTDRTSDIGAMELYASSVVASDPFRLMNKLEKLLPQP